MKFHLIFYTYETWLVSALALSYHNRSVSTIWPLIEQRSDRFAAQVDAHGCCRSGIIFIEYEHSVRAGRYGSAGGERRGTALKGIDIGGAVIVEL